MDRFFGLDRAALEGSELRLLATLYDDILVEMYEALLKEEGIPFLRKDRSGGTAMRILMGNNLQGTDLYVPAERFEQAQALFTYVNEEAAEDAEDQTP
ncbi:MAG: DUF2007 domain-containing protein [Ruminococcaceae bacterium]|nr:DUF2007 domain-containing protein [Oscillospiraceae bacterium]